MENSDATPEGKQQTPDEDSIEVPGAEVPDGTKDHDDADAPRPGSPGTLQDLAADAMTEDGKD